MNAPQIVMIVLLAVNLVIALLKHGEPQGNYSFGTAIINTIVMVGLLIWGDFWN